MGGADLSARDSIQGACPIPLAVQGRGVRPFERWPSINIPGGRGCWQGARAACLAGLHAAPGRRSILPGRLAVAA